MLRDQKSADELQEYLRYVRTEWMGLEDAPQMNERERALAPRLDGSTRDSLHGWRKPRRRTNVRLYGTPAILKT